MYKMQISIINKKEKKNLKKAFSLSFSRYGNLLDLNQMAFSLCMCVCVCVLR